MKASTARAISVAIAAVAVAAVTKTTIAVPETISLATHAMRHLAMAKVTRAVMLPLKASVATKVAAADAGGAVAVEDAIVTIAVDQSPKASRAAERFERPV